jgi:Kef-type K+ transport system membrane component KefB
MQDALISILAISFFALIAAVLASKFKQPVLLLFLFVGALIGPHALNFVRHATVVDYIIEIGAALLLFTIGLEFDLDKLKKVGLKSILICVFKVGIIFFLGYHIFTLFLPPILSALLAVIISFSSTIIIIKILESRNMMVRKEIPTLVAILIIEDLVAVTMLTFIAGFGKGGGGEIVTVLSKLFNSLFVLILVYIVLLAVLRPLFKRFVLKGDNDSIIIFTAISMILFLSYLAYLLQFSMSLGAFLAGSLIASVVGSKSESQGFHHAISPYAFLFTSLFFIAIGSLVDVTKIWDYKWILLLLIVVVVITRLIAVGLLTYLFSSFRGEQTFFSSIIMISVGEFSLLIAREGNRFNTGYDLVTITSVIIFLSAVLMSFTLNYATSVQATFTRHKHTGFDTKFKIVASYIKEAFDGLDVETTYTALLKKHINIMGGLFIAFFVFLNLFVSFQSVTAIIGPYLLLKIVYWLIAAAILAVIAYDIYKQGKKAYGNLTIVLSNLSFTRNVTRTKRIIKAAFFSIILMLMGLFFPLVIFLADLPKAYGIISILLVALGLYIIKINLGRMDSHLKDRQYPTYQKFDSTHLKKYHSSAESQQPSTAKPQKEEKKPFLKIVKDK